MISSGGIDPARIWPRETHHRHRPIVLENFIADQRIQRSTHQRFVLCVEPLSDMPDGVAREVSKEVYWEVDLPRQQTHWDYWSPDFTFGKINYRFNLYPGGLYSDGVYLRFVIKVPDTAVFPLHLRWQMGVKTGDAAGFRWIMNGERAVEETNSGKTFQSTHKCAASFAELLKNKENEPVTSNEKPSHRIAIPSQPLAPKESLLFLQKHFKELTFSDIKYDFPGLEESCVEFLKTLLSTTTTVSEVIFKAVKHDEQELLKSAVAFFSEHLEEIMVTVEWQRFLLANPIQANEICLKAVKIRLDKK